jgi:Ca-activated chloride channel family protein
MRRLLLCVPLLLLTSACGMEGGGGSFGDDDGFGATPGGVKDLTLARELVANGQIPPAEALLVEAMFAEHDLGLTGAPCNVTLCLKAAAGVAPDRGGADHGWLQVGLSSNVDPDTWQRPATTFIYAVDVSGSMGWQYADDSPTPGHLARTLLHAITNEVTPADEVAIVTYGSDVTTALPITSGAGRDTIHAAIDALTEDGSTNMEAGLERAYDLGAAAVARGRGNVRVILFTDEQPNVGATEPSQFETIVADGAARGVGLTVAALGLGIGAEVLAGMSHLRGANAFSVIDNDEAAVFMNENYPWFTTPIAYDLDVDVAPSAGLGVDHAYGFPGNSPALSVSTVFLSKHKGALLISLSPADETALDGLAANLELSFTTAAGEPQSAALHVERGGAPLDERGQWFAQTSVASTTALALLVSGMHDAAAQYASDPDAAEVTMQGAYDRYAADAAAIGDPQLPAEVDFAAAMLQLIIARAPQGSLYGT